MNYDNKMLILFYSDACQHCNMLLDMIKKNNNGEIKCVHIDNVRKMSLNIDDLIKSLPALYLIEKKEFLFGKELFDYLLLPNSGIIHKMNSNSNIVKSAQIDPTTPSLNGEGDSSNGPIAFSVKSKMSDNFYMIDMNTDTNLMHVNMSDRNYGWSDISVPIEPINTGSSIEKKQNNVENKSLPSLESIMKQRELDVV